MRVLRILSNDRMFLDRLATHMLAFEGGGSKAAAEAKGRSGAWVKEHHVEWFEGNFEG